MAYAYPPQQVWQPYPMRTTAPVSLHVVAVFQYLGGLLSLAIGAVFALAAAGRFPDLASVNGLGDTWTSRSTVVTPALGAIAAVFAVAGLIAILLGRKLQRGRNWARVLLTVLNVLSIAGTVWEGYTTGGMYSSTLASAAFPLLFVILLNTRAARSWCHHGTY